MSSPGPNRDLSILSDDCVLYIAQYLANDGDFRTLARMMLLSKSCFGVVAAVLYGSLFRPELCARTKTWSEVKKRKLATLLLFSSGIVDQDTPLPIRSLQEVDSNQVDTFRRFDSISNDDFFHWIPRFATPLTTPYHKLVKFMDQKVFEWLPSYLSTQRRQLWTYFSPLFRQIDFANHVYQFAITNTSHRYRHLTTIRYNGISIWSLNFVTMFVLDHAKNFPGMLKTVSNLPSGVLEVVRPAELEVDVRCLASLPLQSSFFSVLKSLTLSATTVPAVLGKILQQCRVLETIRVTYEVASGHADTASRMDHFKWAADELELGREDLVPTKKVLLEQVDPSSFKSCLNGLRNSLEHVSFSAVMVDHPTSLDWQWELPRLTVLELNNVHLDMTCVGLCLKLEELKLHNVQGTGTKIWFAPLSLRHFEMMQCEPFYLFRFECLASMSFLETIRWSCELEQEKLEQTMEYVRKLETANWKFDRLLNLELGGGALEFWQDRLPTMAPNLTRCSIQSSTDKSPLSRNLITTLARKERLEILDLRGIQHKDLPWTRGLTDRLLKSISKDGVGTIGHGSDISFPRLGFLLLPPSSHSMRNIEEKLQMLLRRPGMKQVWYDDKREWSFAPKQWQKLNCVTLPTNITFPTLTKDLLGIDLFPFPILVFTYGSISVYQHVPISG